MDRISPRSKKSFNLFQLNKKKKNLSPELIKNQKNDILVKILSFVEIDSLYKIYQFICTEWQESIFGINVYDKNCVLQTTWNLRFKEISSRNVILIDEKEIPNYITVNGLLGLRFGENFIFKYKGKDIYPINQVAQKNTKHEKDLSFVALKQALQVKDKYDYAICCAIMAGIYKLVDDREKSDKHFAKIVTIHILTKDRAMLQLPAIALARMQLFSMALKLVSMELDSTTRNNILKACAKFFLEKKQPNISWLIIEKIQGIDPIDALYIPLVPMCAEYGNTDIAIKILNKLETNSSKAKACQLAILTCQKKKNTNGENRFHELKENYSNLFHKKNLSSMQQEK
ncbi:MAG: hypothetical protein COZ46_04675 [Verrucomicrobia bacterium CG_4_10_14_3_um_filter_43_23]|nr:MAG: hypothetical protein AUJ82_07245 [Verrucomicrobia bacterium CG1_02_43_26]PIP58564.1 MAG: hypothetical protein COX01_08000 [Verrucomicrobia bacterium CG22_combo_CG10-13_8_21_14_all_43_17]PIX58281.1 MAG: hypothetical protein COZ46_04675 [Verrucomicrobia bacterium CG_4_10_14_3_um_filter_43_23]PIY60791.1 MAG: hypothetical protein COY94_08590 [Verrucomicrobia bacterium CG_4_10_14_0_8_um_filter_43_34]PJA43544.1 MAG: hypothetical protein CO175_07545 [Verrucomicrobia bacterium CG_4_9_14_3_um_fi